MNRFNLNNTHEVIFCKKGDGEEVCYFSESIEENRLNRMINNKICIKKVIVNVSGDVFKILKDGNLEDAMPIIINYLGKELKLNYIELDEAC